MKLQTLALELILPREECVRRFTLSVRRQHILKDAIDLMELASEDDLFFPLNVNFIGESSVDDGGPRREFASLLVFHCQDSHLMEGSRLSFNIQALDSMDYLYLGRLIALTLLQGGSGLPLFDPPVAEYIVTGRVTSVSAVNFPLDEQPLVEQLLNLSDETAKTIDDILPDRQRWGSMKPAGLMTRADIQLMVQAKYIRDVIGPWHATLAQFLEGLNLGSVLTILRQEGLSAIHFFDRTPEPLTVSSMETMMEFVYSAAPGSNHRRDEEDVARTWLYFLRATHAGRASISIGDAPITLRLEDVLMWLTGSNQLPAVGFSSKISISFRRDRNLPYVSTCGPTFELPILNILKNARRGVGVLTQWLLDSPGFGQV